MINNLTNDRVSKEDIAKAKQYDLLTYLERAEPHNLKRTSLGEYCLLTHDSLRISNGLWHWFSRGIGGRTALDYLILVRGHSFVDAVREVLLVCDGTMPNREYIPERISVERKKKVKQPFVLPLRSESSSRLVRYLLSRGIDKEIIRHCISQELIYESAEQVKARDGGLFEHHNAVFCGKDEKGAIRCAAKRALSERRYYREVTGSDKRFGFCIHGTKNAEMSEGTDCCLELRVFESAIDAMSEATITMLSGHDWRMCDRLALGGVATKGNKLPLALEEYLRHHKPEQITLCLDNDKAGKTASIAICNTLFSMGYDVSQCPPPIGKDYNDFLILATGGRPHARLPVYRIYIKETTI